MFHELPKYCSDWEIGDNTRLNAMKNHYNLVNHPLKIGSNVFLLTFALPSTFGV